MNAIFTNLESVEALDSLFEQSNTEPVFLFKHSATCGISADIQQQVAAIDGNIHIVTVQNSRHVSNAIEAKTGIRHASPQAFVIRDGKVVYHATHYGIDPLQIEQFLAA